MNPTLIIVNEFGDELKIEIGISDDDYVEKKTSFRLTMEEHTRYYKADNKKLEDFAVLTLAQLGYKIKSL